jgi:hypothetical protein
MRSTGLLHVALTVLAAGCVLALVAVAKIALHVDVAMLTRDFSVTAGVHPFTGALSNLGAFLWCAAAAVCLVAAFTLRHTSSRRAFWFLLLSGALSAYLLLDDFFLFHDHFAPGYLGIDETVIVAILGLYVAALLVGFRRVILGTNHMMLAVALGFLASSVVVDHFQDQLDWLGEWRIFLEDGTKWLGIASWCSYYGHASSHLLITGLSAGRPATDPGTESPPSPAR